MRVLDIEIKLSSLSDMDSFDINKLFDLRDKIHPKKNFRDENFKVIEYFQVFMEKQGFNPNLSILDLLFNKGPEANSILRESVINK